jgi:coatomer protein complex subunit gamma
MIVKEMTSQPSIYIVTSSLMKDIHHKSVNFRRNSLKIIPLVIDPSNLVQVERYIKGLVNDADPSVASGALLAGLQMFYSNEEMIRKWGTEIVDKLNSRDEYVQYHALLMIGETKKKDMASLKKTLFSLIKQDLKGVAAVQHLRMMR